MCLDGTEVSFGISGSFQHSGAMPSAPDADVAVSCDGSMQRSALPAAALLEPPALQDLLRAFKDGDGDVSGLTARQGSEASARQGVDGGATSLSWGLPQGFCGTGQRVRDESCQPVSSMPQPDITAQKVAAAGSQPPPEREPVICPETVSCETWQRLLGQQAALHELSQRTQQGLHSMLQVTQKLHPSQYAVLLQTCPVLLLNSGL